MIRRALITMTVASLLILPTSEASAQGSPTPSAVPEAVAEGLRLEVLASEALAGVPSGPIVVRLERVNLRGLEVSAMRPVVGPELLFVESGPVRVTDDIGLSFVYATAESLTLVPPASYSLQTAEDGPATLIRYSIAPAGSSSLPPDTTVDSLLLLEHELAEPGAASSLALGRAVFEPGATVGPLSFDGLVALFVADGSLTIERATGSRGLVEEGAGLVLPSGEDVTLANRLDTNVTVLLAGLLPSDGSLIGTVAVLPTPSPVASPAETMEPSPGMDCSSTEFYRASRRNSGFERWDTTADWRTVRGMLVNDGSNFEDAEYVTAPFPTGDVGCPDYAVQASIQYARGDEGSFGIISRASGAGAYWSGIWVSTDCESATFAFISAGADDGGSYDGCYYIEEWLVGEEADVGTEFRTYRVQVDANTLRLDVDRLGLETVDNRFLDPGQVGLWSTGIQISVRCFEVIAIDEPGAC